VPRPSQGAAAALLRDSLVRGFLPGHAPPTKGRGDTPLRGALEGGREVAHRRHPQVTLGLGGARVEGGQGKRRGSSLFLLLLPQRLLFAQLLTLL
jgi:hypothetical protein